MHTTKYDMLAVMAMVALFSHAAVAGVVFSEDFSTDPFGGTARWGSTTTWNTAGFNYDSSNETANFWASGMGSASCTTTAGTAADPNAGYIIEFDFIINNINDGGPGSTAITAWAQRQSDDSHYYIKAYVGGNGAVNWSSGGGGMNNISNSVYEGVLVVDTWYTMHVECYGTDTEIQLKAIIYEQGTTDVAVPWSATAVDSSTGRFKSNAGFGFEGYTAQSPYDNFMDFDNFVVTQIEVPQFLSDDFSTDPFAASLPYSARWTKESLGGYGLFWAYSGWDPASLGGPATGLPTPVAETIYGFSTAEKRLWTNDITTRTFDSYIMSHDFIISGDTAVADISIGHYVQRQAADPAQCYLARFALGGNGQSAWGGIYAKSYSGEPIVSEIWYTLETEVVVSDTDVSISSRIVRKSDGHVMNTSGAYVDSSPGRLTTAKGYGLRLSLPGTRYWSQAVMYDNFQVIETGVMPEFTSDDFSTDPFTAQTPYAARWTVANSGGYGLYWAYPGWDPGSFGGPAVSLPAPVTNALYTFSSDVKEAWTNDTTERDLQSYLMVYDFMVNNGGDPCVSLADDSFGQYLQRQDDDSAYLANFAIGGNGQTAWSGDYSSTYGGLQLEADTWYQLVTQVTTTDTEVAMQSKIIRVSDGTIMNYSPMFVDTSAGRYTTSKGYGIRISCPGTHYWNQALQVDNFAILPATDPLAADVTGPQSQPDYYVNAYDLAYIASDWLKCSDPDNAGCTNLFDSEPTTISRTDGSEITIDGDLSEWASADWIQLDQTYYGTPSDVTSAQFAVRWSGNLDVYEPNNTNVADAGYVYVAVVVDDSMHMFTDTWSGWDDSDRVEIYIQGRGGHGGSYITTQDVAQQYVIGIKDSDNSDAWAVLGTNYTIPSETGLQYAVSVSGSELRYEVAIRAFDFFGGIVSQDSVVSKMAGGESIGFDVVADTRWGTATAEFGMLSENMMTGKSASANYFAVYDLDAGCYVTDINESFAVDLDDFAILAGQWMQCNNPLDPACQ